MRLVSLIFRGIALSASLLIYKVSIAQCDSAIFLNNQKDTIGIRISLSEWNKIISDVIDQASLERSKQDTSYLIKYVRVVNTIEKRNWFDKYADVRKVFYAKVHINALKVLNASFYKGGAFYCQAFDLYIGGPLHANSMYYISIDNETKH